MLKRSHYIAFTAVILLVVIILALPARTTAQLKIALSSLFLPFFGLASSAHQLAERAGNGLVPRRVLLSQIEQLSRENQQLKFQLPQFEEAQRENERLRQLLAFRRQTPWKLKPVRVIGRDTANWWRTVKIDFGRDEGAQIDLPVLSTEGLVGRISEVGLTFSQVTLVGDPNCRVAALVLETRENGIIGPSPSGPLDHTFVEMILPRTTELKPGHRVMTSGLGGIFPKGIVVGEILDSRYVSYGLYQEARVKLAVNANRLEEVFVKLP